STSVAANPVGGAMTMSPPDMFSSVTAPVAVTATAISYRSGRRTGDGPSRNRVLTCSVERLVAGKCKESVERAARRSGPQADVCRRAGCGAAGEHDVGGDDHVAGRGGVPRDRFAVGR